MWRKSLREQRTRWKKCRETPTERERKERTDSVAYLRRPIRIWITMMYTRNHHFATDTHPLDASVKRTAYEPNGNAEQRRRPDNNVVLRYEFILISFRWLGVEKAKQVVHNGISVEQARLTMHKL